ncbi:hypothetical protein [Niabella aquatica]
MRNRILIALAFCILIIAHSCNKSQGTIKQTKQCIENAAAPFKSEIIVDICNTEVCSKYIEIWKELFKKENNINDEFFNKHISLYGAKEVSPSYLRVFYTFNINYATKNASDIFYIKSSDGTFLLKEDIIKMKQFGISKISNINNLYFNTYEAAYNAALKKTNVTGLCFEGYSFDGGNTGTIIMNLSGRFIADSNRCISSSVNLHTGAISISEGSCYPMTLEKRTI